MINTLSDDQFHKLIESIMQHPHSAELQQLFLEQLEDDCLGIMR
jgi:hypothetical protein